jgi:hypothetical protein
VQQVDSPALSAVAPPLESAPAEATRPIGPKDVLLGLSASVLVLAALFLPQIDADMAQSTSMSVWIFVIVCFVLLARRRKWKRPWLMAFAWIFGIAIIGIACVAVKAGIDRYKRNAASQHADEMGEQLLTSIEKFDPDTGQQMRQGIGTPGQFGKLFKPVFLKAATRTSDQALIEFSDATGKIISPNGVVNQDRCYSTAMSTSWSNLSPAEHDALNIAMIHVFDSAVPLAKIQTVQDHKEVGKSLVASIATKVDPKGLFNDDDAVARMPHEAVCSHYLSLMNEIRQLPSQDRAAVLRFMMNGGEDAQ